MKVILKGVPSGYRSNQSRWGYSEKATETRPSTLRSAIRVTSMRQINDGVGSGGNEVGRQALGTDEELLGE